MAGKQQPFSIFILQPVNSIIINKLIKNKMKKIYLDYAATTPTDPKVLKAMLPYFTKKFGNSVSLYSFGQEAKLVLEESRKKVADLIKAKPNEIIFTSSATESNNLALKGIALANNFCVNPRCYPRKSASNIIISSIEHPCIIESAKWLESQGFKITRVSVNKYGLINLDNLQKSITKNTILVSIIHANNEIGTIQPIKKIGEIIKQFNIQHPISNIYFHTDCAQSFGKIPINVNKMNIDLLTASSHKMYGPKGAACLFVREGTKIEPILHGGGHESGLRSSTINLPAIVGFADAVKICQKQVKKGSTRLIKLRDKLIKGVLKIKGAHLTNLLEKSLPNITNFWVEGIEGESLVIQLDLLGIAASTGSACSSTKLEPSHVLLAIGLKPHQAHGSLRLSLGRWTTEKEIDYVLKVLPGAVEKLRKISPFH
jgi:cysteine desulfurase